MADTMEAIMAAIMERVVQAVQAEEGISSEEKTVGIIGQTE